MQHRARAALFFPKEGGRALAAEVHLVSIVGGGYRGRDHVLGHTLLGRLLVLQTVHKLGC